MPEGAIIEAKLIWTWPVENQAINNTDLCLFIGCIFLAGFMAGRMWERFGSIKATR